MDFTDSRGAQEKSEDCHSLRNGLRGEENEQKGEIMFFFSFFVNAILDDTVLVRLQS